SCEAPHVIPPMPSQRSAPWAIQRSRRSGGRSGLRSPRSSTGLPRRSSLRLMHALKAQVKNGRLVLDEPTDLPEGEVVELVPVDEVLASGGDYLDDEERKRLHV